MNTPPNPLGAVKALRCNLRHMDPAWRMPEDEADVATAEGLKAAFADYVGNRNLDALVTTGALKASVHPVLFEIRRLPTMFLLDVIAREPTEDGRRLKAFRAACHKVEHAGAVVGAVSRAKGERFGGTNENGVLVASEEWVEWVATEYGAATVVEMGQVALDLARARKDELAPFSYWGGSAAERY